MSAQQKNYGWDKESGMSLYNKIRTDMKQAMVNKDTEVRDTMRLIMGAFPELTVPITLETGKKTTRVKKPEEITDEDILGIIRKFIKAEKTVLELKKQTGSSYLDLLERYLPKMATPEEIRDWVRANVDLSAFKSPLQATGLVMKHFGSGADGSLVQSVLKGMTA